MVKHFKKFIGQAVDWMIILESLRLGMRIRHSVLFPLEK